MERLQQAIALTQQATGQLQGMFKRLASKMEQDVRVLGQAVSTLTQGLERLTRAHNALVDEVQSLRAELRPGRASARAPAPARTVEVVDVKPNKPAPTPAPTPAFTPGPEEDAMWYEGGAEDES